MPRKPRLYLPNVPCHVVQRGVDRRACFFADDDYRFYLYCLNEAAERYNVNVHAYVLMTNHVHLLMTPLSPEGISRVMQLMGNRYVQYINKQYCRTGTLWEGRHKSSLIDAENYLLACYRYIELNPVRAKMVSNPCDYPWSSYRHHVLGESNPVIKDHDVFYSISSDVRQRQECYRALFQIEQDNSELSSIRQSVSLSTPLGDNRFKEQINQTLNRVRAERLDEDVREEISIYMN